MKPIKTNKKCKSIRPWLYKVISSRISLDADWIQNHIDNCPKCQRRIASMGKIKLAFMLLKSQSHNLDLLMRANTQAIGVLKHGLRYSSKAEKLRIRLPEPKFLERCSKYKNSIANVAACIAILFLMKTGIFYSINKTQDQGQKIVKQYYANQIGDDLADELFSV